MSMPKRNLSINHLSMDIDTDTQSLLLLLSVHPPTHSRLKTDKEEKIMPIDTPLLHSSIDMI